MMPDLETRLALRQHPRIRSSLRQRWSRLLFLHLEVDPSALQTLLPPHLRVDLHEGKTYLGIIPFFMERVRPTGLLPIPGLSWFLELNVRCYVLDPHGQPGVYFFSLDCNQPLAVLLARSFFHLPYQYASMHASISGPSTSYRARRYGQDSSFHLTYQPSRFIGPATPGSLEFFWVERYLLHTTLPSGQVTSGRVHHQPYQLHTATWDGNPIPPLSWNQLPFNAPFLPALYADAVDVDVFALRQTS